MMKNEFIGRLKDKDGNFHTYYILEDEFGFPVVEFEINNREREYDIINNQIECIFLMLSL